MWYSQSADSPFVNVSLKGLPPQSTGVGLPLCLFGGKTSKGDAEMFGKVPMAWNGTLFLQNVHACDGVAQDLLVRVADEGYYEPVLPAPQRRAAHCCLIGTSNPESWIDRRTRTDLTSQLAAHLVQLPPLRSVAGDIPFWMDILARETSAQLRSCCGLIVPVEFEFSYVATNVMQGYTWPGNHRELSDAILAMQMAALAKPHIPLRIVIREISRLKSVLKDTQHGGCALPNTQEQLHDLLTGFDEYMRLAGGGEYSRPNFYNYVARLIGKDMTPQRIEHHLQTRLNLSREDLQSRLKEQYVYASNTRFPNA
jgi:DNA-binding NtrC family response regulator